jgi:hypothetical protein
MQATVFVEIVLDSAALLAAGIEGRDEIEDPLAEALGEQALGEVTGGGSGAGTSIVEVEVPADQVTRALAFLSGMPS